MPTNRMPLVRSWRRASDRAFEQAAVSGLRQRWKACNELELIRATGSNASDLEEWLRNDFFGAALRSVPSTPLHLAHLGCRKRDGFQALLNYHKIAEAGSKGRQLLESLTYATWVTGSRANENGVSVVEGGAEDRLVAAWNSRNA